MELLKTNEIIEVPFVVAYGDIYDKTHSSEDNKLKFWKHFNPLKQIKDCFI
jgi:hypothetical protein